MSNTVKVKTDNGQLIEVYTNAITAAFDEYVASLADPDLIFKSSAFNGGMKYCYKTVFQPDKPQLYNKRTNIDTGDVELLNSIWDIYTALCYRYGHRPTVIRFSILTGISMETFNSWEKRSWRNDTLQHSESVKRWKTEAENALVDGASESNSIGSIFLLKSNFNYRESAPITPYENQTFERLDTPEQIRERHKNAKLPEMPNLD